MKIIIYKIINILIILFTVNILCYGFIAFAKVNVIINPEQHKQELEQIKEYVKNKNIKGLIEIFQHGEISSRKAATKWLGYLEDESALPVLEIFFKDDQRRYELGNDEVEIAIYYIKNRNKTNNQKIKDLLELKKNNYYVAEREILRLESMGLNEEEKISKYIQILKEHKTPQLAEGAQNLLIDIGKPATLKVVELLKQTDAGRSNTLAESFNIKATVSTRCIRILQANGDKAGIFAIGEKINDDNLYVKGSAISALQIVTGENFGFDFADIGMGTYKDEFQKTGQEKLKRAQLGIKKAQEWWRVNKMKFKK